MTGDEWVCNAYFCCIYCICKLYGVMFMSSICSIPHNNRMFYSNKAK